MSESFVSRVRKVSLAIMAGLVSFVVPISTSAMLLTPGVASATANNGNGGGNPNAGNIKVNVCHATSSDTNPYVFITPDSDSVQLEGHLMHRTTPNKTWKSDGTYNGVDHVAGQPKPDLIGSYTDGNGAFHLLDGNITEASCPTGTGVIPSDGSTTAAEVCTAGEPHGLLITFINEDGVPPVSEWKVNNSVVPYGNGTYLFPVAEDATYDVTVTADGQPAGHYSGTLNCVKHDHGVPANPQATFESSCGQVVVTLTNPIELTDEDYGDSYTAHISAPGSTTPTKVVTVPANTDPIQVTFTYAEDAVAGDIVITADNQAVAFAVYAASKIDTNCQADTGTLTVIKKVVNNVDESTKLPSDFTMTVASDTTVVPNFPGSSVGTKITLNPGAFQVGEIVDENYTETLDGACDTTIKAGDNLTCTITNTKKAGSILGASANPGGSITPTCGKVHIVLTNVVDPAEVTGDEDVSYSAHISAPGSIEDDKTVLVGMNKTVELDFTYANASPVGPIDVTADSNQRSFLSLDTTDLVCGGEGGAVLTDSTAPATLPVTGSANDILTFLFAVLGGAVAYEVTRRYTKKSA